MKLAAFNCARCSVVNLKASLASGFGVSSDSVSSGVSAVVSSSCGTSTESLSTASLAPGSTVGSASAAVVGSVTSPSPNSGPEVSRPLSLTPAPALDSSSANTELDMNKRPATATEATPMLKRRIP